MVRRIRVSGYRSIRELDLRLERVNVLVGPNGCGKSNLYNSLALIARAAEGQFARAVMEEGGMPSLLWAGPERVRLQRKKPPRRVVIAFETDDLGFEIQAGLPKPGPSAFSLDPKIKMESIWPMTGRSRTPMLERNHEAVNLRDADCRMQTYPLPVSSNESVLWQIVEAHLYPELAAVRSEVSSWRFYHQFRTDAASPIRQPQNGVQTPALSRDGSDLAAALQTIVESGDHVELFEAVKRAFRGGRLAISAAGDLFRVMIEFPDLLRPLDARELSDGQIRFLCLCAALLSPRPPRLLGLNEPETSLHPDLIEPLARLITYAGKHTQLWITTHSQALAEAVTSISGFAPIQLALKDGETVLSREAAT